MTVEVNGQTCIQWFYIKNISPEIQFILKTIQLSMFCYCIDQLYGCTKTTVVT